MSAPTPAEKAAAYRLAAEYIESLGLERSAVIRLLDGAARLDPPKPPLPTERTWHPNVRADEEGDYYLPGALRVGEDCWVLLTQNGYAVLQDDEVEVFTPAERQPRVLWYDDHPPCPEVGSAWRAPEGNVLTITEPGYYEWSTAPGASTTWGEQGDDLRFPLDTAYPLTEVLS